jgi:hypothetical protein
MTTPVATATTIAATTPTSPHRSLAVLKLPTRVSDLITVAICIVQGMSGNAAFPNPVPDLDTVSASIVGLQNAETTALTRVRGAVAARDAARDALVTLLDQLRSYVQRVADGDRTNAPALIQGAAMDVKKTAIRQRQTFGAKPGAVTGSVTLVAPLAGPRAAYDWEWSLDGGKTWQAAPGTLRSKTTLLGLTPGATVSFRYRALTKGGEGDWSQVIAMIVR